MTTRFGQKTRHAAVFFILFTFTTSGCEDSADLSDNLSATQKNPISRQDPEVKSVLRQSPLLDRVLAPSTSDLNENTRTLRVLVSYNKTNLFELEGQIKGFEAELVGQYEKYLRGKTPDRRLKIRIVFVVLPFEELIPTLIDGHGDIVAAGLTVTPERQKRVSFSIPYIEAVDEIIVAAQVAAGLAHRTDLSGRKIHVVLGSSHARHLKALNQRFAREGLAPIEIIPVGASLAPEDLLEMVNAGIFELTVADNHIAELWASVFTRTIIRKDLVIHSGGDIAWAVRQSNPRLLASVNSFLRNHREGTLLGNLLIRRYYEKTKWIRNPLSEFEKKKLEKVGALFRKYAEKYGFDWLQVAALAYQESRFDQRAKSQRGAIGIMQVKPETAADPSVDIKNISTLENNIHAGVKYLALLRDMYFDDPAMDEEARLDFIIAAYNAGPARVNALRRKAKKLGINPDKWFSNVEHVAGQEIGIETVRYVSNVHKYYIAYKSMNTVWNMKNAKIRPITD